MKPNPEQEQQEFIEALKPRQLSPLTQSNYKRSLRKFLQWLEREKLKLHQVSYNTMLEYGSHCKKYLKPVTINTYLHVLQQYSPCVISGCNLTRRKKEIFTSGSIADAVHASGTIPWIFKFKSLRGELFLDGGLVDKVPLETLAERIDAEVIIVHYILSQNLNEERDAFLSKVFPPQKAYTLSMNIARHEHYLTQLKLVRERGIAVIELRPALPQVTPDRLDAGRDALEAAYRYAKAVLAGDTGQNLGKEAAPCATEYG